MFLLSIISGNQLAGVVGTQYGQETLHLLRSVSATNHMQDRWYEINFTPDYIPRRLKYEISSWSGPKIGAICLYTHKKGLVQSHYKVNV